MVLNLLLDVTLQLWVGAANWTDCWPRPWERPYLRIRGLKASTVAFPEGREVVVKLFEAPVLESTTDTQNTSLLYTQPHYVNTTSCIMPHPDRSSKTPPSVFRGGLAGAPRKLGTHSKATGTW